MSAETPAGGAAPAGATPTPTPGRPLLADLGCCVCGHLDVMHDFGRRQGVKVRTKCSISDGKQATPCPCTSYTPRTPQQENSLT